MSVQIIYELFGQGTGNEMANCLQIQYKIRHNLTDMEHEEVIIMCKTTQLTYTEVAKILIDRRNKKNHLKTVEEYHGSS